MEKSFFEMVEHRHSVRHFTADPVGKEEIAKMLKVALDAPSSKNTRSSSFLVVEDPERIARIARMRDFGSAFVEQAPLVILVMGDAVRSDLWVVNASISATYLQLAAEALGLGAHGGLAVITSVHVVVVDGCRRGLTGARAAAEERGCQEGQRGTYGSDRLFHDLLVLQPDAGPDIS